jgi:hypothetical protein
VAPAGFKANELRALRSWWEVAFNNIGCRRAILQEQANNRRCDPENALVLHVTDPT